MKITSTRQARNVVEAGKIVFDGSDYMLKVLEVNDSDVKCINVEYDEELQDYKEIGKTYYKTYTDFVGNEIDA